MELWQKIESYMGRKVDFMTEVLLSTVDDLDGSPKITKTREVKYTDETGEEKTRLEPYEEYKPAIPAYVKQWNITDKPQPTQKQLDAITKVFKPKPTIKEQIADIRQETDKIISTPQVFLDKYTFDLTDVDSLNSLSDLMEFKGEAEKKILDKTSPIPIRHTITIDDLNELVRTMASIKDQLILKRDDKIEALQGE